MYHNRFYSRICWSFLVIALSVAGCKKSPFQSKEKPELIISGDDPRLQFSTVHFFKDTVYVLATSLQLDAGESLVIDAGTLIKVNNRISITINPGAVIEAEGTAEEPIIFTSAAFTGGAGIGTGTSGSERYWHGIKILGNSLTNPTMSSGKLRYVRIEFAGDENIVGAALLLQDVTRETVLENIQVSYAYKAPSFDISGGNCNAKYLVSYAGNYHDFYIHNGYQGKLQHLLAWRHPYFPNARLGPDLAGMFIQDDNTFPVISNLMVIGPDMQPGISSAYMSPGGSNPVRAANIITTQSAKFRIRNSVMLGFPIEAYHLDNANTALSLVNGESELSWSVFHTNDTAAPFYLSPTAYPPYTSNELNAFLLASQMGNTVFLQSAEFMLSDPFNYDLSPNPSPQTGSPLLSGADFTGNFDDPFFDKVSYRGAIGSENWLQGWTNFLPLQTNYNN